MAGSLLMRGYRRFRLVFPVPILMSGLMAVWLGMSFLVFALEEREVFAFSSGASWFHRSGGHLELLPPDPNSGSERSMLFFSVPRPLQTVQRAELWEVIAALQASRPCASWGGIMPM